MSKLDRMLKEADAEEAQKTRQIEQVKTNQELYPERLKDAAAQVPAIEAAIERLFELVLGAKPDGNPLPGFKVEEDFDPEAADELRQRLDDAHKALVGSRGFNHRFVPSLHGGELSNWLLPLLGVFLALGIASSTQDWFVHDWVKVTKDGLTDLVTVLWWASWIALGFFGFLKLREFVSKRLQKPS